MQNNPYTPGAGWVPAYLAGREQLINDAGDYLSGLIKRNPQQSVIYYGLRGVGKTVLLNTIELAAENHGAIIAHLEAGENENFTIRLLGALKKCLGAVSVKENAKTLAQKGIEIIKAFSLSYNMEDKTFSLSLDQDTGVASGVYIDDLTDVFVTLGKAALQSGDSICIFIDEIQELQKQELEGLIMAIHRCNQLRLPIMVFGAGLPKILKEAGEACSYAERLFKFISIGPLSVEESRDAIIAPAETNGVNYTDDAVQLIVELTGCYPYFIQALCRAVWEIAEDCSKITISEVENARDVFFLDLDNGFFSVRYNRCTRVEKDFLIAMVKCGQLPCAISNVAKKMNRSVKSISPCRAQLISKGMIYATNHAEIDFTVPQFDGFIRRINPSLEPEI